MDRLIVQKGQLMVCSRAGLGPADSWGPLHFFSSERLLSAKLSLSSTFSLDENLPNVVNFLLSQGNLSRASLALSSLVVTLLNDLLC